jgi:hypothetical protein
MCYSCSASNYAAAQARQQAIALAAFSLRTAVANSQSRARTWMSDYALHLSRITLDSRRTDIFTGIA